MLLSSVEKLIGVGLRRRGILSRWVESSAGRHHLYDGPGRGALPPVALLHGIGASAANYAELLLRLQPQVRRLIAPEAIGHGLSRPPRLKLDYRRALDSMVEVLDQVLDEPTILYGNSLGGATALHYALARPQRVAGLVLSSPAGAPMIDPPISEFLGRFRFQSARSVRGFMDSLYLGGAPWYVKLFAGDVRNIFGSEWIRALLDSVTLEASITPAQLSSLQMPILIVWGKGEQLMPPSHLEYYRQNLPPNARLLEPTDFGHCPHLERAEEVTRLVVDFARSLPVRTSFRFETKSPETQVTACEC